MGKNYEKPKLDILIFQEEIVRTSTGRDPFDDGYIDYGDNQ